MTVRWTVEVSAHLQAVTIERLLADDTFDCLLHHSFFNVRGETKVAPGMQDMKAPTNVKWRLKKVPDTIRRSTCELAIKCPILFETA